VSGDDPGSVCDPGTVMRGVTDGQDGDVRQRQTDLSGMVDVSDEGSDLRIPPAPAVAVRR